MKKYIITLELSFEELMNLQEVIDDSEDRVIIDETLHSKISEEIENHYQ